MNYNLKSKIVIEIETELEDTEVPDEGTVEYLLLEDLQDLGYGVHSLKTLKFTRNIVKD